VKSISVHVPIINESNSENGKKYVDFRRSYIQNFVAASNGELVFTCIFGVSVSQGSVAKLIT